MTAEAIPTELEQVLLNFEDTLESRRQVLGTLIRTRVYVVMDKPWDSEHTLDPGSHLLLVSDGENANQAMLALFTSKEKIAAVPTADSPFQYPVEVDARWALLGVPKAAGIRINPNSAPGFRIDADLSAQLRGAVERTLPPRPAAAGSPS